MHVVLAIVNDKANCYDKTINGIGSGKRMKFVFDLDGTICFKGQPISKKILHSISALTGEGHDVIFSSARPIRDMLAVIDKSYHHYTMIGGNGVLISREGRIIRTHAFSSNKIREMPSGDLFNRWHMGLCLYLYGS